MSPTILLTPASAPGALPPSTHPQVPVRRAPARCDRRDSFTAGRVAIRIFTALAIVSSTMLAQSVGVTPAQAQMLELRRGVAAGENGAVARQRGMVSNGEGQGAARRRGVATDGQGNGAAGRGGCAVGQIGSGCRGGTATWSSDGSISAQSGAEFSGDNGSFSGRRTLNRDADGTLSGTRTTDASGDRGAYSGASSLDSGTYNRDGTYSGTEGQSATVEGYWDPGAGGSRAVTCVDASGAVVDCR